MRLWQFNIFGRPFCNWEKIEAKELASLLLIISIYPHFYVWNIFNFSMRKNIVLLCFSPLLSCKIDHAYTHLYKEHKCIDVKGEWNEPHCVDTSGLPFTLSPSFTLCHMIYALGSWTVWSPTTASFAFLLPVSFGQWNAALTYFSTHTALSFVRIPLITSLQITFSGPSVSFKDPNNSSGRTLWHLWKIHTSLIFVLIMPSIFKKCNFTIYVCKNIYCLVDFFDLCKCFDLRSPLSHISFFSSVNLEIIHSISVYLVTILDILIFIFNLRSFNWIKPLPSFSTPGP